MNMCAEKMFAGKGFVFLLILAAGIFLVPALQGADSRDECWVRRCYSWNGVGTMTTAKIKLYGEDIRIRYASPSRGFLRITIFDAAAENPRAPRQVVNARQLQHTGSKTFSGYKEAWLLIEGDDRNWMVEVDQYLTRIQEWRWRQDAEKKSAELAPEAEWGGVEGAEFEYTPRVLPCRITFANAGAGGVSLAVRNEDEALLFSTLLDTERKTAESWLYKPGKHKFRVISADTEWSVKVDAE